MAAEDDEIDILGDFSLDGCANKSERTINSTYSELLKCDYSVHPQWLLDTASTAYWYDNPPQEDGNLKSEISSQAAESLSDDDGQPSTSHSTTEWTIYEREMLKKGIEIYGRDNSRLSVFLGSKTPQEVQLMVETEYGINLDFETPTTSMSHQMTHPDHLETTSEEVVYGEVLNDNEIPASIEEVIGMVSTAVPTVPSIENKKKIAVVNPRSILRKPFLSPQNANRSLLKKSNNSILKITSPNSLLIRDNNSPPGFHQRKPSPGSKDRKNIESELHRIHFSSDTEHKLYGDGSKGSKSKKTLTPIGKHNSNDKNKSRLKLNGFCDEAVGKSKFNISLTMNKKDAFNQLLTKRRRRTSVNSAKRKGTRPVLGDSTRSPRQSPGSTTFMQIVTGSGQALSLSKGEQVIKIEKNSNSDADSDIDIDIDSDGGLDAIIPIKSQISEDKTKHFNIENTSAHENNTSGIKQNFASVSKEEIEKKKIAAVIKTEEIVSVKPLVIPESLKALMMSLETPKQEYVVNPVEISEFEKFICPDFFEGRPAKTPDRYRLIRAHLVASWRQCRPHYLTKTSARHGLRNCGDVNCIGRIHTLMEQLGAINLGCEQTTYIRPLSQLLTRINPPSTSTVSVPAKVKASEDHFKLDPSRQRKKKIVVDGDGGYTITHGEFGEIYESVAEPKQQKTVKKKHTRLIYCKSFSEDHPAPYRVTITLSTLILIDFHAHTSRAEVMGLLGGKYDPISQTVSITNYVPCDSLDNSGTHCDMCPVSQSAGTEWLWQRGLEPLGWLHSHPLFPPWPSEQDLASQADMQGALGPTPFLALILSPHWQPGRTSSQYRCFYVKTDPSNDQYMAFRFNTGLDCDLVTPEAVDLLLEDIEKIIERNKSLSGSFVVNMTNDICPNAKISFLDKFISSIGHHLKSRDNKIDVNWCKNIIQRIRNLIR